MEKTKVRARDVNTLTQILEPILGEDTKAEAQKLISRFSSINELFDYFAKCDPRSVGIDCGAADYLKVIAQSFSYVLERDILSGPVIASSSALHDYLFNSLYPAKNEMFRILFLDAAHRLIEDRLMGVGTVDRVNIYARQVIKSALELNSTAIVLVHNHPSGDPKPSQADVSLTSQMHAACETFEIKLIDHLIVARSGVISMHDLGLLKVTPAIENPSPKSNRKMVKPFGGCRHAMLKLMRKL